MAADLQEMIERSPELFKTAMRLPDISKRVVVMVTGIQKWGERAKIKVKDIRITGPMAAPEGYDVMFKITKKKD